MELRGDVPPAVDLLLAELGVDLGFWAAAVGKHAKIEVHEPDNSVQDKLLGLGLDFTP